MIKWVPWEEYLQLYFDDGGKWPTLWEDLEANDGICYNVSALMDIQNNTVITIAGLNYIRPGVGELWQFPSIYVKHYAKEVVARSRELIPYLFSQYNLRRIQMSTDVNWVRGEKWAKMLGFTYEGTLLNYGTSGDEHIFSRIK